MKYVLTGEQMQKSEETAFNNGLLPKDAMFSAGSKVFEHAKEYNNVLIVAWCGNNGGDGFVCGKLLKEKNKNVDILLYDDENKMSQQARYFFEFVKDNIIKTPKTDYDCVVDSVFGIGFHGKLSENAFKAITIVNSFKGKAKIISVDVPSGLDATNGKADYCVEADETVTFCGYKQGHFIGKGRDKCGKIYLYNIGIEAQSDFFTPEKEDIKKILPIIKQTAHKGTMGYVGIIAGSLGMEGAGVLAGISALRTSAGKVSISVLRECVDFYKDRNPEIMISIRGNVNDYISDKDVVLFGPGIGRNPSEEKLLDEILENIKVPLIIDADGMYYLSKEKLKNVNVPVIITPHLGEASRLFGVPISELSQNPLKYVREFYETTGATVLLKSNYNIICGEKNYISCFGSPGMATAGSGDVLGGIVAGCYLLTENSEKACLLASYIHGSAGKKAAEIKTDYSVTASDISENIYFGFKELTE